MPLAWAQLGNVDLVRVTYSPGKSDTTYCLCRTCRCEYQDEDEHAAVAWAINHYQHPPTYADQVMSDGAQGREAPDA